MQKYIASLRPAQWVKNLLVLVPIVLATKFLDPGLISRSLMAVVLFSLTASAAYLMNDLFDREKDLAFETKRTRPLAAKEIKITPAIILSFVLAILGVAGGFVIEASLGLVLLAYLVISLWYSAWLQHIAILDIAVLALMTTLRVVAGAVVITVTPSIPLLFTVSMLGVMLAISHRLHEKRTVVEGTDIPLVISTFSSRFLESTLVGSAMLFFLSYVLFVMQGTEAQIIKDSSLFYTSIIIFFVAFRFAYVNLAGPNKKAKKDVALVTGILVFVILFVTLFYVIS
jgi:4-hydroxybenzoate polyprenyltransferase